MCIRGVAVTLALAVFAVAITSCGSAGRPASPRANGGPAIAAAQCMRSHGVPTFPDPSGGGPVVVPNSINPASPAFLSAQKACARFLGGSTGPGPNSDGRKLRLLALAQCIRAHGLASFPDPTTSPPAPPSPGSHTGNVIGIDGAYLALPPPSPALTRAATVCGFRRP